MTKNKRQCVNIKIRGLVQGIGFRPWAYQNCLKNHLSALIHNDNEGVSITIQGRVKSCENFIKLLKKNPPKQSSITYLQYEISSLIPNLKGVRILESQSIQKNSFPDVSPDLATCSECLKELWNPSDRRYSYPFINCTHCGPRFTIIENLPYDRHFTSMKSFKMCDECQKEYLDPTNRRFHAQPNACPKCGPQILDLKNSLNPLESIINDIKNEKIVAVKGLGSFHFCCLTKISVVKELRILKQRPHQSFAIMFRNIQILENFCNISLKEKKAIESLAAPIVLLKKKNSFFDHISPDNNSIGAILPYTPIHHMIMKNFDFLIFTSANERNAPLLYTNKEIKELFKKKKIKNALIHNRKIIHPMDDSILQFVENQKQIFRRARGFVPESRPCSLKIEPILALGSYLKNTFSLFKDEKILLSQHIGNLNEYSCEIHRNKELEEIQKIYHSGPIKTISDYHTPLPPFHQDPNFCFHHDAHLLSVIGEHQLFEKNILGIIADGSGIGRNDKIGGCEFLYYSKSKREITQVGSLAPITLIGKEKAIIDITRIAVAFLKTKPNHFQISDEDFENLKKIQLINEFNFKTTSLGRLFDGISALLNLCKKITYEGQAAILLQKMAEKITSSKNDYRTIIKQNSNKEFCLTYDNLIEEILKDLEENISIEEISFKFHMWCINSFIKMLNFFSYDAIVFSGGCFQNKLLTEKFIKKLVKENIPFYTNNDIPINDGGISFGQIFSEFIKRG